MLSSAQHNSIQMKCGQILARYQTGIIYVILDKSLSFRNKPISRVVDLPTLSQTALFDLDTNTSAREKQIQSNADLSRRRRNQPPVPVSVAKTDWPTDGQTDGRAVVEMFRQQNETYHSRTSSQLQDLEQIMC